jgi:hypothetical protein
MKVTYPPFYFLTFITSYGLHAHGHTHRPQFHPKIPFVFRTKRHLGPDGFVLTWYLSYDSVGPTTPPPLHTPSSYLKPPQYDAPSPTLPTHQSIAP